MLFLCLLVSSLLAWCGVGCAGHVMHLNVGPGAGAR
jgi:hypothetical protein